MVRSGCGLGVLLAARLLLAEGTEPKAKPTEYPVHVRLEKVALGAEYLVRSLPGRGATFVVQDYLVVETAVYPVAPEPLKVAIGQFTLRINGGKQTLAAVGPTFVAASLKYPDWEMRPRVVAGGGIGDTGVILGQPPSVGRFPGDPRAERGRLPQPPRAPESEDRNGIERQPAARAEEVVLEAALPERTTSKPVSGYLYFPYKGKTARLRSLELVYRGESGEAALRLIGVSK